MTTKQIFKSLILVAIGVLIGMSFKAKPVPVKPEYSKGYEQGFYDGYHYDVRTEDYGEYEDYGTRYPK